jgi:hypothetical protein
VTNPAIHEDAVDINVTLSDGRRVEKQIAHAIGSLERPLSDDDLNAKFRGQSARVIGEAGCEALISLAWRLAELDDAGDVARAAVPVGG